MDLPIFKISENMAFYKATTFTLCRIATDLDGLLFQEFYSPGARSSNRGICIFRYFYSY